jgi:hypothetical protein
MRCAQRFSNATGAPSCVRKKHDRFAEDHTRSGCAPISTA